MNHSSDDFAYTRRNLRGSNSSNSPESSHGYHEKKHVPEDRYSSTHRSDDNHSGGHGSYDRRLNDSRSEDYRSRGHKSDDRYYSSSKSKSDNYRHRSPNRGNSHRRSDEVPCSSKSIGSDDRRSNGSSAPRQSDESPCSSKSVRSDDRRSSSNRSDYHYSVTNGSRGYDRRRSSSKRSVGYSPPSDRTSKNVSTSNAANSRAKKRPRERSQSPCEGDDRPSPQIRISSNIFESSEDQKEVIGIETAPGERIEQKPRIDGQHCWVKEESGMKMKFGDEEITEEMLSITNFFEFTDPSRPLPAVAPTQRNVGELGAPEPKMPKVAHYNQHNPKDEVEYVEELRAQQNNTIPDHESDTDDEDNQPALPFKTNKHLKEQIFEKYNFEVRRIDPRKLATYKLKEKIISTIESNRVVIIDGFTGSGKTTQVPQIIVDRAYELKRPCNVIVTQPRKLAAISVSRRVCEERGWELGSVVGYQVGMDKKVGPETLVTYVTTGVLLQKLTSLRSLKSWTHIIVDEVHERDLQTDLLLLFIKKILSEDTTGREKHVKLILMSATIQSDKFSRYFAVRKGDNEPTETPVIKIHSNMAYRVDEVYLDQLVSTQDELNEISSNMELERAAILPEMYTQAVRTVVNLDLKEADHDPRIKCKEVKGERVRIQERGSVLIFLPGLMEIKLMLRLLQEETKQRGLEQKDPDFYEWDLVPLHSTITSEEQRKVFEKPCLYRRKIILSTNIAESSITVADIVYVIDFCLTKSNCVDTRTNFNCLRLCWASAHQCIQRKGRTGRVRNGTVFRMVTKEFFSQLPQQTMPDMLKSALEDVVLQVKILNMGSPKRVLSMALDPPELSGIERAVANLKELGALTVLVTNPQTKKMEYDTCNGDVTFMGQIMAKLPIHPQCSRLILLGHCFGVMKEAIIIAAGLSGKSPFAASLKDQLSGYMQKLNWSRKSYSDCFAILHAYRTWYSRFGEPSLGQERTQKFMWNTERSWARIHCVQIPQMREIRQTVEDIEKRLKDVELKPYFLQNPTDQLDALSKEAALMLKIAIAGAFYPNYFHRHHPDLSNYEREMSKEVCGNDLFSTVYYKNFPQPHQGKLYAKYVADALSHGLYCPFIKFDGQKVLAMFDTSAKKIGPICEGVYRAVKKRQIREQVEFKLLPSDRELQEVKTQEEERKRRNYIRCPPQFVPPGVQHPEVLIFVTFVESPSQFWIMTHRHESILREMQLEINNPQRPITTRPYPRSKLFIGALVLAPYSADGEAEILYYRGRIDRKNNMGEVLICFIDYGNSKWVSDDELRELSDFHLSKHYHLYPGMANACRLSELKPSTVYGSVWPEKAIEKFREFTRPGSLTLRKLKIWAVYQSLIYGELVEDFDCGANRIFNINESLKAEGFAEKVPEPHNVRYNNDHRARYDLFKTDKNQVEACNKDQMMEPIDQDFLRPPENQQHMTNCTLKGPWSPLELEFQSLCNSSTSKQVTVDTHSVNSVLLDPEPTAPAARLLVASSIGIQERSGRVVARETTVMPAVPGMIALMSLIFTPKAELRCDPKQRFYTGVLCGLGPNEKGDSIYMDHDCEVIFDTEIDDDDIDKINEIRLYLNMILKSGSARNCHPVHSDLTRGLFRLLQKKRKKIAEEVWPQQSYVWNVIDRHYVLPADKRRFCVDPLDIFLPHDKIELQVEEQVVDSWNWEV